MMSDNQNRYENITDSSIKIGSIDEKGYLAGFYRRGYTPAKALLELYANNLDALEKVRTHENFTKKIVTDSRADKTSIIDNGVGMVRFQVESMFALHKSNHGSDTSRGVSGIGAKPAMSILSEKKTVTVFTHSVDGPYLRITAPWDEIHSKGVYTGMIDVSPMTYDQEANFIAERRSNGMLNMNQAHGTTMVFDTNDTLSSVIESTFAPISEEYAFKNHLDRVGIVFGHDQDVDFIYRSHNKPTETIRLDQYDYFGGQNSQFYTGKTQYTVEQWRRDKDGCTRYVLDYNGEDLEITKNRRGYSKDPEKVMKNMNGYQKVGTYNIIVGMRSDNSVFNHQNPSPITGKFTPGIFNSKHLGVDCNEFLWVQKLFRNNQLIGYIPNPNISLGSIRANGDSQIAVLVQVEIHYNPLSSHGNFQDLALSIQENKNQYDGKSCPVELVRIAGYVRSEKAKQVSKYMKDCIETKSDSKADSPAKAKAESPAKTELPAKAKVNSLSKGSLPNLHDDSDKLPDYVSEEKYITRADMIESLNNTVNVDQKITKTDFKKLFDKMQLSLFGE